MSTIPVCDDGRYDPRPVARCPICGLRFQPAGRGRYCSSACRQRAWRLRRGESVRGHLAELTASLRRDRRLVDQTVYQCVSCGQRYLGQWRCPDCNLMCRRLGLGGYCPDCDQPVAVADLIGIEPSGGAAPA